MIHYLLQSSYSHPDLSNGRVPAGLLTPAEQAFFDRLKSEKRRYDWLLGRWTGKRLVRAVMGNEIPLNGIEILAADDGAPMINLQSLTLSISHSHDHAFCGLVEGVVPLGVDIERVEARTEGFVRDYFVGEEIALVETVPRENRSEVVTAIWSAKEAALKAIRLGLLADTFAVKCLPQEDGLTNIKHEDWSPVLIEWDFAKLKRPAPELTGWWRVWNDFVFTIAVVQSSSQEILDVPMSS